jgi:hypothetical protein
MRTPIPRHVDTPREQAAAEFVFVHFALTVQFAHDAWRDFRVQACRRRYLAERNKPQQGRIAA